MYHLVVYRKADGGIERVISKPQPYTTSLVSLGYNPVLYDTLRVVSKERVAPSAWKVEKGLLTPLGLKKEELSKTTIVDHKQLEESSLKITFVGDAPTFNTGFGTQYRLLKEGLLKRGCVIDHLSYQEIPKLVDNTSDFIIVLSDYGSIHELFKLNLDNVIYWFALESPVWPEEWNENLQKIPHLVPLTRYGRRALQQKSLICKDIIPHGVDTEIFRPLPLRQRGVLRQQANLDSKFVISYIGTNVERKRLDLLIASYAFFVSKFDQARKSTLLLKTKKQGFYNLESEINKNAAQYNVPELAGLIEVREQELTAREIAQLINVSDLGFNATAGEGFCVPAIEYLMCGVPFLAGRHTSFVELIGSHLPLIAAEETYIDNRFHWQRYKIDVEHAASLIGEYYATWTNKQGYDRIKLREAVSAYTSSKMLEAWDNLLTVLERQRIEQSYLKKAGESLLKIGSSQKEQVLYEKASRAVDGLPQTTPESQDQVKWIQVY